MRFLRCAVCGRDWRLDRDECGTWARDLSPDRGEVPECCIHYLFGYKKGLDEVEDEIHRMLDAGKALAEKRAVN